MTNHKPSALPAVPFDAEPAQACNGMPAPDGALRREGDRRQRWENDLAAVARTIEVLNHHETSSLRQGLEKLLQKLQTNPPIRLTPQPFRDFEATMRGGEDGQTLVDALKEAGWHVQSLRLESSAPGKAERWVVRFRCSEEAVIEVSHLPTVAMVTSNQVPWEMREPPRPSGPIVEANRDALNRVLALLSMVLQPKGLPLALADWERGFDHSDAIVAREVLTALSKNLSAVTKG